MYTIQLVWNREFHWVNYAQVDELQEGIRRATNLYNSGDGMRVKKVRIIDEDGNEVWKP